MSLPRLESNNEVAVEYEFQLPQDLIDLAERSKKNGTSKDYHIRAPICLDKIDEKNKNKNNKSNLTQAQFKKFIDELEKLEIPYTFYLVPNDLDAYREFLDKHAETLKKIEKIDKDIFNADMDVKSANPVSFEELEEMKVALISKWRETPTWKTADLKYNQLRLNRQHGVGVKQKLDESVNTYLRNHPGLTREDIESHYEVETRDYISWFKQQDDQTKKQNILLYPFPRPQVLENANKNAGHMGYYEDSLPHFKWDLRKPKSQQTVSPPCKKPKTKNSTQLVNDALKTPQPQMQMPGPADFAAQVLAKLMEKGLITTQTLPTVMADFYGKVSQGGSPPPEQKKTISAVETTTRNEDMPDIASSNVDANPQNKKIADSHEKGSTERKRVQPSMEEYKSDAVAAPSRDTGKRVTAFNGGVMFNNKQPLVKRSSEPAMRRKLSQSCSDLSSGSSLLPFGLGTAKA